MGGKRQDKADAWKALYKMLHDEGILEEKASMRLIDRFCGHPSDEARRDVGLLFCSGRLDVQQIKIIKRLLLECIRVERAKHS